MSVLASAKRLLHLCQWMPSTRWIYASYARQFAMNARRNAECLKMIIVVNALLRVRLAQMNVI